MAKSYAYVGAPSFIGAVEGRLADAGFSRGGQIAAGIDDQVAFRHRASSL